MSSSAVILAGGCSNRLGRDKGLLRLANKPLVSHVLDAVKSIVNEKIVVVSSRVQKENYARVINSNAAIIVDKSHVEGVHGPLIGALAGFEEAHGEYSLLLPCDTPFASKEVLLLLLDLALGKNAAIPRWPNGYVEPLQAAYRTKAALKVSKIALEEDESNVQSMISRLTSVRYVSTLVIQQLDSQFKTFFNVNTLSDLRKAEALARGLRSIPRAGKAN